MLLNQTFNQMLEILMPVFYKEQYVAIHQYKSMNELNTVQTFTITDLEITELHSTNIPALLVRSQSAKF